MSANLDDFLPSIFRKRKPVIKDEWGGPSDQNILDSSGVVRSNAPASVAPVVTDTPPIDPTAAMVGQDLGGTGTTRARRVETDNKGRPIANTTMTGAAQAIDLNQRIHDYHPQAAQGWWDKWGKEMVTGAVKGLRYGSGGALGGAVAGGISGKLNPEMADEQWKEEQIANSDAAVNRIAQGQQSRAKADQEAAQTAHTIAQTKALTNPQPKFEKILTDNGWALLDPASGTMKPVVDPKTNRQAQGKPTGAKSEWVHDEKGIAHKYEDGKDTGQLDPGRNLKVVPGYGLVPPGQAMNADATAANRETERQDRASQDVLTNSQLDENIRTATQSRDAMGPPPPVYIEKTSPLGDKEQVVNPAYNEWQSRRTAYDSQIAEWKRQKKAPPSLKPTLGGRKYTVDPKFLQ